MFIQTLVHIFQPIFSYLEHWVGDWGIAVIFFTILVRKCLFPISLRQSRLAANQLIFSQKAAELQKSWTGKKEDLSLEIARLMKEHKFNPLGIIFNALLQSPILITVYAIFAHLGATAPLILVPWVNSIGIPDPWFLIPLAIAITNGFTTMVSLSHLI